MIYHVYILYSLLRDRYYIGHTGDIIEERLRRHNTNHKGYSGKTGDWEIVYTEVYNTKEEARISGKERSSPGKVSGGRRNGKRSLSTSEIGQG